MQTTAVTRSLPLPVPVDQAWAAIRDADGLSRWLGDSVDLDVVPGAAGTVVEDGTVRRVVVTDVVDGESIGLVWWDEAAPEAASVVTIAVAPDLDGSGSIVTVTERVAGAAVASVAHADVAHIGAIEAAWDARLQALVGEPALAPACV